MSAARPRTRTRRHHHRLSRSTRLTGWIGAAVLSTMLLACLGTLPWTLARTPVPGGSGGADAATAGALRPRRFEATDLERALLPPFWASHTELERERLAAVAERDGRMPRPVFGTDLLGRDLFVRCLAGGGISLAIGLAAACVAVLIGTTYGAVAGYLGGSADALMMRGVDVLYGLPNVLLVVLLAVAVDGATSRSGAELSPGVRQLINAVTLLVAIGGVTWLTMARVIRGQVLSLRRQAFIEACRAAGIPLRRQFLYHLLPNLHAPIIVYATLTVPSAILTESFLSFLGIGVKEPLPSWGNLAASGLAELNVVRSRWWLLVWPCLFVAVALLALNFVGEALRAALDPKSARRRHAAPERAR